MTIDQGVSIVLPLQDEERTVDDLLHSVAQQSHLPDEIILVDAGSQDRTVEKAMTIRLPRPLRVIRTSRVFPGIARNEGVSAARYNWIAFTDGGIVLRPEWLQELLAAATEEADVVFGGMEPVCDSFLRECAALAYVPPKDVHGTRGPFIASSLVRRSKLLGVGGFPEYRAAEDLILVHRLQASGAKVVFAPNAQVQWQIAGSMAAIYRRFASYSYHNLIAGWGRYWHLGVGRLYVVLALAVSGSYLAGGGSWTWLAVPLFFVTRAVKAAWVKRHSFAFSTFHPGRILGAAVVIVVIDAATLVGLGRWLGTKVRP